MTEPRAVPLHAPAGYPFPKTAENLLTWSRERQRLEEATSYWIVTASAGARPHVTPVWGVWIDDALYFDGSPSTRWSRNLRANPRMTVHLESTEDVVIVDGTAEDLPATSEHLAERIIEAWNVKYGRLHPDPAGNGILRLTPRRARGWSTSSLNDGTAWEFE